MTGDDQLLGELKADRDDHERRIATLEDDMRGVRRFQTSFMAIMGFVMATVVVWSKGLKSWWGGL
jgi:hypothetical protein